MALSDVPSQSKTLDWADMADDTEDTVTYTQSTATGVAEKVLEDGTRVVTEIISRDGGKYKVTKYLKVIRRERTVYESAKARKARWVPFGKAKDNEAEMVVIGEPCKLELGKKEELSKSKMESEIGKMVARVSAAVQGGGTGAYVAKSSGESVANASAAAVSSDGPAKYVPPGASGSKDVADGGKPQRDDTATVRISNLSEDISEDDLRGMFSQYGSITRAYLAVDKVTKERRGFAFITFKKPEEAEEAIRALHRYPFNHVILNVTWARPATQKSGNTPPQ